VWACRSHTSAAGVLSKKKNAMEIGVSGGAVFARPKLRAIGVYGLQLLAYEA
jgi:hypothetical protein